MGLFDLHLRLLLAMGERICLWMDGWMDGSMPIFVVWCGVVVRSSPIYMSRIYCY